MCSDPNTIQLVNDKTPLIKATNLAVVTHVTATIGQNGAITEVMDLAAFNQSQGKH